MKDKSMAWIVLAVLVAVDGAAWLQLFAAAPPKSAAISFLDVGQGDSSFLALPGGVRIMTDAGPDSSVVRSLEKVLGQGIRSIDLAIITHPELDHFNGFNYLIEKYSIGAFIINGRDHPGSKQWAELMQKIRSKDIPLITLGEGDVIRSGDSRIDILSPNAQLVSSSELNDGGMVEKVRTPDFVALFTADIGFTVEKHLRSRYDLSADILKVGHHGSKYSSDLAFLRVVHPQLAVISVSARNTYGHPAPDTLSRLSAAHIPVVRTDQKGTITVRRENGALRIFFAK